MLLVHKPRKRDAWQLPQGGAEEGETVIECALRELREETGITDVEVLGESAHCYQYDFPASYRRFRPDHICGQCISFVFAHAPSTVEVQVDNKEINMSRWVKPADIGRFIKRKEYLELVQNLLAEGMKLLG